MNATSSTANIGSVTHGGMCVASNKLGETCKVAIYDVDRWVQAFVDPISSAPRRSCAVPDQPLPAKLGHEFIPDDLLFASLISNLV